MIRFAAAAAGLALICAAVAPAAAQDDPVIAKVDGAEVRRSDALLVRGRLPQQYQQLPAEMLMPMLTNIVIDTKLLANAARKQGLADNADVKDQMRRLEELVLEQAVLTRYIEAWLTDEAIQKRYEEFVAESAKNEEVHARHILLEHESEAKEVIAELKGGADFAELAKARSTGPSAPQGGDLGFFGRGEMVPEFANAAFALEAGAVSEEPVKTDFGWHVIKVEERRSAAPPPIEAVADSLRGDLAQRIRAAYVEELRNAATIERFEPEPPAASGGGAASEGDDKPKE